jgi:cardiolipin synthase
MGAQEMADDFLSVVKAFTWAEAFGVGGVLHVVLFLAVALHCLAHRRDSRSSVIWLFSAWAFPILGPLGYAAFGISRVPRKAWRKHDTDSDFSAARAAFERESHPLAYTRSLREASARKPPPGAEPFDGVLDRITPDHRLLAGNAIELLEGGPETFPAMLEAIREAKRHIHVMSYIIGRDAVGREILDACAARARDGVKVRVMYDAFGTAPARLTLFFRRYRHVPNMRIQKFSLVNLFRQQFQVNLRNHRKIIVVDAETAFTGGVNLHKGHVGDGGRPPIRDYHFRIRGPLVNELQYTFLRDWYYMTDESPAELLSEAYFGRCSGAGAISARLVNCGPTSLGNSVEEVFFSAVTAATSDIVIVSPYLVLTEPLFFALRMAAMRDVRVRLILPAKNNHKSVYFASRAQYGALLEAGVRIYERRGALLHAKAMIVDGAVSIVGSANMDVRSLRLNYETTVVSYDAALAGKLMTVILADISESAEVSLNLWSKRPLRQRLLENFFSLADPIL